MVLKITKTDPINNVIKIVNDPAELKRQIEPIFKEESQIGGVLPNTVQTMFDVKQNKFTAINNKTSMANITGYDNEYDLSDYILCNVELQGHDVSKWQEILYKKIEEYELVVNNLNKEMPYWALNNGLISPKYTLTNDEFMEILDEDYAYDNGDSTQLKIKLDAELTKNYAYHLVDNLMLLIGTGTLNTYDVSDNLRNIFHNKYINYKDQDYDIFSALLKEVKATSLDNIDKYVCASTAFLNLFFKISSGNSFSDRPEIVKVVKALLCEFSTKLTELLQTTTEEFAITEPMFGDILSGQGSFEDIISSLKLDKSCFDFSLILDKVQQSRTLAISGLDRQMALDSLVKLTNKQPQTVYIQSANDCFLDILEDQFRIYETPTGSPEYWQYINFTTTKAGYDSFAGLAETQKMMAKQFKKYPVTGCGQNDMNGEVSDINEKVFELAQSVKDITKFLEDVQVVDSDQLKKPLILI